MMSIKTNEDLTRRKGFGELQRTVWTLAIPACASINLAIQNLTRVSYDTSDQHREASESRKARDAKGIPVANFVRFLEERNPLEETQPLRNINAWLEADMRVDADHVKEIGLKILGNVLRKPVTSAQLQR